MHSRDRTRSKVIGVHALQDAIIVSERPPREFDPGLGDGVVNVVPVTAELVWRVPSDSKLSISTYISLGSLFLTIWNRSYSKMNSLPNVVLAKLADVSQGLRRFGEVIEF